MTQQQIANIFSITPQRVQFILKKYFNFKKRILPPRICPICHGVFKIDCRNDPQKFCSMKCRGQNQKNNNIYYNNPIKLRERNKLRMRSYYRTEKGRQAIRKAGKKSYFKFKNKALARAKLNMAVRKGIINKPNQCSICGLFEKLDAHHEDYNRPLDVIWVCRPCHHRL